MNLTYELPEVVPLDRSGKTYEGFVTLKGKSCSVVVDEKGVWCDPEDAADFRELWPQATRNSGGEQRRGPRVFLEQLAQLRAAQPSNQEEAVSSASVAALREALAEITELGWDRIDDVSAGLTGLVLRCEDRDGRRHRLEVDRDCDGRRRVRANLPGHVTTAWGERQLSLSALFDLFAHAVASMEPFFREMDALDAAVWILEPERPNRADTIRRIALGEGASLRIEVAPSAPRHPPQLQFLGPEPIVEPLRQRLDSNFSSWNPDHPLLENLEKVLQVTFPSREEAAREDVAVQCGVCYSFNLDGELPDTSCRNQQCHQVFHASCLLEWLRMLPSSRRVFNSLHGECPYCSQIIVVTVRLEK